MDTKEAFHGEYFIKNSRYSSKVCRSAIEDIPCRCGSGGYSIGLYAKVRTIDNKKAYKELLEKECFSIQKRNITISPINEIADIDRRNAVYTAFLKMLKLEQSSKQKLNKLGFLNSTIEEQMYRTIPNKCILRRLIAYRLAKMYDLSGIPGFYQEADFKWTDKACIL